MKKEVMKIREEKIKKQHEDWIKNKEILDKLKETNKLSIDQTQKDILKRKQIWKLAGDQYAEELGSKINKQWRLKVAAIETESSKVKKFEQHLTNKLQLIEEMNISKDVKKFFEDTKSLGDVKEMPNINLSQSQLTSFVPGQIVQSYFGSIQDEVHELQDKTIRLKAIKEYTTELPIVTQILQSSENSFWIHSSNDPKTIQKVTLQPHKKSSLKVLLEVKDYAQCILLTRNGDLLVSDLTSNLKILNGNGKKLTISKYNFKSYIVDPIHINKENQLIVGAVKKLPIDFSVPGGGVVMVMDMAGNHQAKKEKLEKQHKDWIKNKDILNALKETNKFSIDQTKKDIQKQKQIWKKAGNQYATELDSEIDKQWRGKEEAIETESSKVKHFEQHLTDKIQLIEDMSISMVVTKFFEDFKSLEDVKAMPYINLNHSQLPSFVPGEIHQSIFGTIQDEIHKDKIIRIKAIKESTLQN
ncbi:unnamed protein product [Mytilus edulis]|uniref:Uncharacterized protein n=1 Tax=Mytilus edulis TaxID=6550 RepID=A0A8S3V5J9_MYTED|nr:unnamed protein product [Mytilus edulis]